MLATILLVRSADGEEGVVEALRQQILRGLTVTLDDAYRIGVQVQRDQPCQHRGSGRCELRWLQHGAVSRRNGGDEGSQAQIDRVVPGPDDQNGAERVVLHPTASRPLGEWQWLSLAAHPLLQMLAGIRGLTLRRGDVAEPRFDR